MRTASSSLGRAIRAMGDSLELRLFQSCCCCCCCWGQGVWADAVLVGVTHAVCSMLGCHSAMWAQVVHQARTILLLSSWSTAWPCPVPQHPGKLGYVSSVIYMPHTAINCRGWTIPAHGSPQQPAPNAQLAGEMSLRLCTSVLDAHSWSITICQPNTCAMQLCTSGRGKSAGSGLGLRALHAAWSAACVTACTLAVSSMQVPEWHAVAVRGTTDV